MLDKIPTPLSGAICNEKTGWLPPNFDDNCREILSETINELLELQPADFDPNQLASTSRAALAQNAEQAENEWEFGVNKITGSNEATILDIFLFLFLFSRRMKKDSTKRDVTSQWPKSIVMMKSKENNKNKTFSV